MSKTIKCQFSDDHLGRSPQTTKFLKEIGTPTDKPLDGFEVRLECQNTPDIIEQIQEHEKSDNGQVPVFTIDSITSHGIHLFHLIYFDGKPQQDCMVFIPMSNVVCLHTADYFG